jgi:arylsulfatase A-like enzyme
MGGERVSKRDRPNVLVIMTDQQRTDTLGCYGAPICRSPATDAFAQTATRFSQAYSICALCTPARASIYTGQYPHHHGMIRNSEDRYCKTEFDDGDRLIPQYIAPQGYACELVGKWHCGIERLPREFGFLGMNVPGYGKPNLTAEYQRYLSDRGLAEGELQPIGGGWRPNTVLAGVRSGPVEASIPAFIAEETISSLRRHAEEDEPFLLFSNFWGPHAPYFPSEPYASLYDPRDIEPWGNFEESFRNKPHAHRRYLEAFLGPENSARRWEDCARWAALYYGFATQIDHQIGRILGELEQLGLERNTVVMLTTDHGDLLGCHGGMHDKCSLMCQETYHIPFLMRVPGAVSPALCERTITNMDILPTILELSGVPANPDLDGRSLLPLVDEPETAVWEPDVVCEFNGHHYHYQSRMITDGHWKYVFNAPEIDELYDLSEDPWETTNLVFESSHQETVQRFQRRLLDYAERSGDSLLSWMENCFLPRRTDGFTPYGTNYRA